MRSTDSFMMWYLVAAIAFVAVSALWLNRKPLRAFFGQPLSGMGRGDKLLVTAATLVLVLLLMPFAYTPLYAITYGILKAKEVRVIDGTQTALCFGASDAACTENGSHYMARYIVGTDTADFYIGANTAANWKTPSGTSGGSTFMELDPLTIGTSTAKVSFPNGILLNGLFAGIGGDHTGPVTVNRTNQVGFKAYESGVNLGVQMLTDGSLLFYETNGGSDYAGLSAPVSVTASTTYLLPGADGTAGDQLTTDGSGNLSWAGGVFADIYANDVNLTHTIADSGQANKVQVTAFNADGVSAGMTPDHTNDHITVDEAGMYLANVSITLDSVAGSNAQFGFAVYKNNGATEFTNMHCHRDLSAGAGGNSGVVALSGILDLAATDTIEVWVWNETNTQNIVVDDINLSLFKIGPT